MVTEKIYIVIPIVVILFWLGSLVYLVFIRKTNHSKVFDEFSAMMYASKILLPLLKQGKFIYFYIENDKIKFGHLNKENVEFDKKYNEQGTGR